MVESHLLLHHRRTRTGDDHTLAPYWNKSRKWFYFYSQLPCTHLCNPLRKPRPPGYQHKLLGSLSNRGQILIVDHINDDILNTISLKIGYLLADCLRPHGNHRIEHMATLGRTLLSKQTLKLGIEHWIDRVVAHR
ncbi:hypothetical protein SDC9_152653 [bioreactor metagenome]|uniref:Uncharacterized protein n=1 Tax=bioreactor metagenome TaxID=1076179 RepID=A0A645EY38_9ZZZZ